MAEFRDTSVSRRIMPPAGIFRISHHLNHISRRITERDKFLHMTFSALFPRAPAKWNPTLLQGICSYPQLIRPINFKTYDLF
jgi:hypothetical protein